MPTGSPEPPRLRRLVAAALLVAGLSSGVGACSDDSSGDPGPGPSAQAPPDVVRGLTRALHRRAAAVRNGDEHAFAAGLARADPAFARRQHTYFENLAQLPLARFDYAVDPGSLVRDGAGYWVVVDLRLKLDGYDDRPVTSPDRFRFTPGRKPGRFLLASVTDRAWERRNHVRPQPWDTGPIEVRRGDGVLGIFDAGSVGYADSLVSSVQAGIGDVAAEVPYDWPRSVVVYALSDDDFLARIDDLPGGDPESLDGVAFPVPASPGGGPLASTRFVLNPRMLDRAGPERDRLLRHEITHVAVAGHDDRVPVWLSEGVAEYVSVQALAPQDRLIDPEAVDAAKLGFDAMPDDESFNYGDSSDHYAEAWWACEYLADTYGEATLWTLMDAMNRPGADPDRVLRREVGLDTGGLARKAGRLIVDTFAPESS